MSLTDGERAFAESHRLARLATADAAGAPHVVPICYAVDGDRLYFVVDEKPKASRDLKRLRNLSQKPRAAVVIDDYDDDWERLAYLLLQGHADIVTDASEYERVLRLLRGRYRQYLGMNLRQATHPMVRLQVEKSHLWQIRDHR
jgi:PPOX class probable F420-dependent enzyme